MDRYIEAAIGDINTRFYLSEFRHLEEGTALMQITWNWSAFFFGSFWMLYRKMYGWCVLLILFHLCEPLVSRPDNSVLIGAIYLVTDFILIPMYANFWYYRHVQNRVKSSHSKHVDSTHPIEFLRKTGGVNIWVKWVFGGLAIVLVGGSVLMFLLDVSGFLAH
ncbi:MAG: hypothetical protein DHS20C01_23030 [marine bacterium B5-7]|nr:MAG: hypothetical protein DHS20C01_23030 [marine bacterium B5-7]